MWSSGTLPQLGPHLLIQERIMMELSLDKVNVHKSRRRSMPPLSQAFSDTNGMAWSNGHSLTIELYHGIRSLTVLVSNETSASTNNKIQLGSCAAPPQKLLRKQQ